MTDKNDGGAAFPGEQGHIPDGTWNQTFDPGMSLRDWFAGQALPYCLAEFGGNADEQRQYAEAAYQHHA